MALPTSVLGMGAIQTEFGGSNPIALSEYYGVNANVASSGTIRMASFLGISAAAPSAQVLDRSGYDFGYYSANCSSIHQVGGTCLVTGSVGNYTWLLGGAASDYQVRYTKTGTSALSFSTGMANNTWIGLGTERRVWLAASSMGYYTSAATVSIRWASNSTVIMTATHSFIADVKK